MGFNVSVVCVFLLFISNIAYAAEVIVVVSNVAPEQGTLKLALHRAEGDSTWDDAPVAAIAQPIEGQDIVEVSFGQHPASEYAIRLYHDVNGNNKLDTSDKGRPMEPVGFSNNPSLLRGRPPVKKAAFIHSDELLVVNIKLKGKVKVAH